MNIPIPCVPSNTIRSLFLFLNELQYGRLIRRFQSDSYRVLFSFTLNFLLELLTWVLLLLLRKCRPTVPLSYIKPQKITASDTAITNQKKKALKTISIPQFLTKSLRKTRLQQRKWIATTTIILLFKKGQYPLQISLIFSFLVYIFLFGPGVLHFYQLASTSSSPS